MFHLLVEDAASVVARGQPVGLQLKIRRAFTHAEMRDTCKSIVNHQGARPMFDLLDQPLSRQLRYVAKAFTDLQEERHWPDYEMSRTFERARTIDLLLTARAAVQNWRAIRKTPEASIFLYALLLSKRWNRP